jgi:hypothetical protein
MRWYRYRNAGALAIKPPPNRHLAPWKVVMARGMVDDGAWTLEDAARHFGCSPAAMKDALEGRTWKAVADEGDPAD